MIARGPAILQVLFLCLSLPAAAQSPEAVDGDSLRLAGIEYRLWGIDAPEWRQTCEQDSRSWHCGRAAARALRALLRDRELHCETVDRDRHGRAVARCRAGGVDINDWMVRQGWAIDYTRYSDGAYAPAEAEARAAGRGIWRSRFVAPEQWRRENRR